MSEKKRYGWTEKGIVGFVFVPIGCINALLGLILWAVGAGEDPEDPMIFLCVFGGVGLVLLAIGLGLILADVARRSAMRRAFEGGYYVMGKIAGVRERTNVNTGTRHPLVLECHFTDPDTGTAHVCFSRYLYFDPEDLLKTDEVPVYLERMGKGVFVDIDAVLPQVVVHR